MICATQDLRFMRHVAVILGCFSFLLVDVCAARAQHITVQEPSLETFGVGTTVSVPDRGRMSLGGVRRSASARAMYGPVRTGHSMGFNDQGTGLNIQARVHDLAELDQAALDAADRSRQARDDVPLSPAAEHAYQTLQARWNLRTGTNAAQGATEAKTTPAPTTGNLPAGPSAGKLLERARQAEAAGKRQLALAYLKVARDQGSAPAQREIERLGRTRR
jgi:hypothetical protein